MSVLIWGILGAFADSGTQMVYSRSSILNGPIWFNFVLFVWRPRWCKVLVHRLAYQLNSGKNQQSYVVEALMLIKRRSIHIGIHVTSNLTNWLFDKIWNIIVWVHLFVNTEKLTFWKISTSKDLLRSIPSIYFIIDVVRTMTTRKKFQR